MAFLNKKEQTLISAIKADKSLSNDEKRAMIQGINDTASLRQHGWRLPVREFIQAMAEHKVEKLKKVVG